MTEPTKKSAKTPALISWSGFLAAILLTLLPLSVLLVRSGSWQGGLVLYALACLGSILFLILFVVLIMLPRFASSRGTILKRILLTLPGTFALLALTMGGGDVPPIHDITTDTADPPLFVKAESERGSDANSLAIKPGEIAQHQAAYPDLQTLRSDLNSPSAFGRALSVADQLGWSVYHQDPGVGVIEAVETTQIMHFKDDIVIRVRAAGTGSEIDLRSVSRVGKSDLGANAKRIRAFIAAFKQG